jgi:hypothetical protein
LICQKNDSCSCPMNVGIGNCDCQTRTSGNESYFNGYLCVRAGLYNETCPEGNDYECQVLTQNLRCNTSTKKCACQTGKTWNETQNLCQ